MASAQEHPLTGQKVGFLGAGMMAGAMIRGLMASGVAPGDLMACDVSQGLNQNTWLLQRSVYKIASQSNCKT
jgi:pyrroline-5-carboxylate reductase